MRHKPRLSPGALCLTLTALAALCVLAADFARTSAAPADAPDQKITQNAEERAGRDYGSLPLSFEPNRGQAEPGAQFVARGGAYAVYVSGDRLRLALRGASLRIRLLGANADARAAGLEELEGRSNYLRGGDPSRRLVGVPNYARVKYESVYEGVDVVYYGNRRQLEYDFNVAPGADVNLIRMRVEGAKGMRVDEGGDLVLQTAAGEVRQRAPLAYQEFDGARREVECRYALLGAGRVGFRVGAYDRARPLVIDPVLTYSTYLGGAGYDYANAVALDAVGNAYVVGRTSSWDFPVTPGASQGRRTGAPQQETYDAFVTKLNAEGTAVVYSTFLGGYGDDNATSVAVDAVGRAYVAGDTESATFPTTPGAYRAAPAGGRDVFVAKLDVSGSSLAYSTYLGGTGADSAPHVGLGRDGVLYVGGRTQSHDFPVTPGVFQPQAHEAFWNESEGFVTKLDAAGASLLFSTYLGGNADDYVEGLAVARDIDDSVYVTGRTESIDFPTTGNAFQQRHVMGAAYDLFVTRLNANGTWPLFSTYLGGAGDDLRPSVAVDSSGSAYVAAATNSDSLPVTPGALQPSRAGGLGGFDAFVAKLDPYGLAIEYLTYYGGAGEEDVQAVAVDSEGKVSVVGQTSSADLPLRDGALQPAYGGGDSDGYFLTLYATGDQLYYATYVGRGGSDAVSGLALDSGGNACLAGTTLSPSFPVTPGVAQPEPGGNGDGKADGFVMKLHTGSTTYNVSGRVTNDTGYGLSDVQVTATAAGSYNYWATTTDADGYYVIKDLPPGSDITVAANRYGFPFTPPEVALPNLSRNETVNFTGPAPLIIRGQVKDEWGNGIDVPVSITSADGSYNLSAVTYYEGRYMFVVPAGGTYTVTPGPYFDPDITFAPPSRTAENVQTDQTFDFAAQRAPRIFGHITDPDSYYSSGVAGVRVTLSSPALAEPVVLTTDPYGYFFFDRLERGATYTVTPSDPETNRTFLPASKTVENIQGWEFLEFQAQQVLGIHGMIRDAQNNAVTGHVALAGAVKAETETDEWGFFRFDNLPRGGDYAVTVTKPGSLYTFAPPSRAVANLQERQFFEFQALPPLSIRGRVAEVNNSPVPATVTLTGSVSATAKADEWGFFRFDNLPRGGDYTVAVSYPLYTFAPPSRSVTNIDADTFLEFEAMPPLSVNGVVVDENWTGVAGVTVTLSGAVGRTAVTDEWGSYSFKELPRGGDYTVTAAHDLYNFVPPSRAFPSMGEDQNAVFNAVLRRFTLRGRVAGEGGAPLAGVDVYLRGGGEAAGRTDANGEYAFADLPFGRNYSVTAARAGYSFAPAVINVNDPRGDQRADFAGARLTYALAGRVTDGAGGSPLAGVTMTLGGSTSATTQTDAQGNYAFAGLPSEGNYTVSASHPHFGFAPAARAFDNLLADASGDFAGTRLGRKITGRVTDGSGAGLSNATVTLGGARGATAQTDPLGYYLFDALPSGFDYSVTVAKSHYAFAPPARQFDALGADASADFTATLLRHRISGRVVDANGNGFAGAVVGLVGGPGGAVTTDSTGNYSFDNLPAGQAYTVEPSRQFYSFSPVRGSWLDLGGDQTANFTATLNTYSIGGRVAEGAAGVAGVTVNLGGTRTAAAQTDAAGNYVFTGLPANGTYTVTPAAGAVYVFSPASANFNTLPYNQTANFAAARNLYQVAGALLDPCGRPLGGFTLSLTHDGVTTTAQTNASGAYAFPSVQAGYSYTLAPTGSAYAFAPAAVNLPGLSANQTANFTGTPPVTTTDVLPLADLYVRGGNGAGSFFGTAPQLVTRLASQAKDTYESYLKFDVGQPCSVGSVKLRLYGQLSAGGTLPVSVYGVPSTTWTETATNWNNKPAAGALIRTVNVPGTTAAWYEWDVTAYVRGELAAGRTTVAFALKSTTATTVQVTFNSREATGPNGPRLAVTTP